MSSNNYFDESLKYHSANPPGKIQIGFTKPCEGQEDLSLAYTPGVAAPCMQIKENPEDVWKYTNKGNTTAVISDGSAVLGLGDIGAEAGLPVMEGKSILFKKFADIDSYPICMSFESAQTEEEHIDLFVKAVTALQPSLGAINLEDVKAPRCFEVQERLQKILKIPVFHDDQYGTAIIVTAGILNAVEITGRRLENCKIVINGAGAAGIACAKTLLSFGVNNSNIYMCDSKGLIVKERTDLNKYKELFAQDKPQMDLAGAIKEADIFIGVSVKDILKKEMVQSMAKDPIIFAVANPIPEIMPADALEAGAKVVGTGRSDYSNQVNNSLGFPGLFRGVLDTRASEINNEMKMAATRALASLAKEPFDPETRERLSKAYTSPADQRTFSMEKPLNENYVIPKQFDLRVVPRVARYVAKAAMDTNVATIMIDDLDAYEKEVYQRIKGMWA